MFVYIIVNQENGKIYIGKTIRTDLSVYLRRKFSEARNYKGSSYLFNAMNKYPPYVWAIYPLISTLTTNEDLCFWEKVLIAQYDSQNPDIGYNICKGGEGFTGPFTVEHRAKLSAAAKLTCNYLKAAQAITGVPRSVDIRAKISKGNIGKTYSLETRDKIRKARLSQPDPRLGKTHSDETKKRISKANMGAPGHFLGGHHTDEAKEKNRKAHINDIQGQQFGNIVVVSFVESSSHAKWLVRCIVCGAEGIIARGSRIKSGESHFIKIHNHK